MYCLYAGVDYTYIYVNALAQGIKSMFGFKPLLGLEHMAPSRPQLLVSHANHSATETSICMYVCVCVCVCVFIYIYMMKMYIYTHAHAYLQLCV